MSSSSQSIALSYAGGSTGLGHMLKLEARVGGRDTVLIFDTGIGVNLISKSLAYSLNCIETGSVSGQRMTGQSVTIPMGEVESLEVGNRKEQGVSVGLLDLESFLPKTKEFSGVEGYLSLTFFKEQPFTIDYRNEELILESTESLKRRTSNLKAISIKKKLEDSAITIQLPVKTPLEKSLNMQLDLGTNIMTINSKYMGKLAEFFKESTLKQESMVDETDFVRSRSFVKLNGLIGLGSTNDFLQMSPTVMFQDIIYDGIIGNDFFKNKIVTIDLKSSKLYLSAE